MTQRRAATEKAKATRARSWQKNQVAKQERVADQETRHAHNVQVGSTGKQRAKAAQKPVPELTYAEALEAEMNEE